MYTDLIAEVTGVTDREKPVGSFLMNELYRMVNEMAKSMTGFGRCEVIQGERKISVEMKSVNNRYLDLNIRLPRQFNPFEADIRNLMKSYVKRGKVDVYIQFEEAKGANAKVHYNKALARGYFESVQEIAKDFNIPFALTAGQLSLYPDVLVEEEEEKDEDLEELLLVCAESAVKQFVEARVREGAFITKDLFTKLDCVQAGVMKIEERAPGIIEKYRNDLYEKMLEVLQDAQIDENRILQEAAIYSDRVCVDEELVRLKSHIEAVRTELKKEGESVGRKLDFLVQEMNREANTILSKTVDAESAGIAIDLKTEIERIREQIQNLE